MNRRTFLKYSAAACFTVFLGSGQPVIADGPKADLVLFNGKVITVDKKDRIAEAVAVRNGIIVAVGTNEEVLRFIGPKTKALDLVGRTVTPGLIDSHNHLMYYGQVENDYVNLRPPAVTSIAQVVERIELKVEQVQPGEWIVGDGFFDLERVPTRSDLDPVSPDNPVFLNSMGGHFGTANGKALEAAEITSLTTVEGGSIELDPITGEPNGVLWNHPAMDLVRIKIPPFSVENLANDVRWAQDRYLTELGGG
jgi:predicted amidohydrolase YtcJ